PLARRLPRRGQPRAGRDRAFPELEPAQGSARDHGGSLRPHEPRRASRRRAQGAGEELPRRPHGAGWAEPHQELVEVLAVGFLRFARAAAHHGGTENPRTAEGGCRELGWCRRGAMFTKEAKDRSARCNIRVCEKDAPVLRFLRERGSMKVAREVR